MDSLFDLVIKQHLLISHREISRVQLDLKANSPFGQVMLQITVISHAAVKLLEITTAHVAHVISEICTGRHWDRKHLVFHKVLVRWSTTELVSQNKVHIVIVVYFTLHLFSGFLL